MRGQAGGWVGKPDGRTLTPNEPEQAVILEIQAMRIRKLTLVGISEELTRRGVPTKTGKSRRWTHQSVAAILKRTADERTMRPI